MPPQPTHGGNLIWAAAVAGCSAADLLDFSASISPLGPPPSVLQAIQASLPELSRYPDPQYQQLRQCVGAYHGLPADWVLPGNGAAELLTWAARDLAVAPASPVVALPTPAFGDYGRALEAVGLVPQAVPMQRAGGWRSGGELITALQASSATALVLNNPHNPSGSVLSVAELCPLLDRFTTVVVDEAFMDFLPPSHRPSLIDLLPRYPNLVVLRSLTKFFSLPGLRVGYALAHPERLRRWQGWRDPWPVNGLVTAAVAAALADTPFHQRTWDWLATARPELATGLGRIPGLTPLPGVANYLLVHSQWSVPALQTLLLQQHRLLIRDCLSFAELGADYFRVAVRTPADNQRLLSALAHGCEVAPTLADPAL